MPYMNRDEMIGVIRSGQVVLHKGRLLVTEADVPAESELAQGDPAKIKAAKEVLEARKRAIEDELSTLDTDPSPATLVQSTATETGVVPPNAGTITADLKSTAKGK